MQTYILIFILDAEDAGEEPGEDEVIVSVKTRSKKKKGQREEDVKDLPREAHDHPSVIWSGDRLEHLHFGERKWSGADGFEHCP